MLFHTVLDLEIACVLNIAFREFAVGAIAGGAAGLSVETALYPIDTIKTRLQASTYNALSIPSRGSCFAWFIRQWRFLL
jgi:hypothetical protein